MPLVEIDIVIAASHKDRVSTVRHHAIQMQNTVRVREVRLRVNKVSQEKTHMRMGVGLVKMNEFLQTVMRRVDMTVRADKQTVVCRHLHMYHTGSFAEPT